MDAMTAPTYTEGAACCALCGADLVVNPHEPSLMLEVTEGRWLVHAPRACELTAEVRRLRAAVEEAQRLLSHAKMRLLGNCFIGVQDKISAASAVLRLVEAEPSRGESAPITPPGLNAHEPTPLTAEGRLSGEVWRGVVPRPFSRAPVCAVVLRGGVPIAMVDCSTLPTCVASGWHEALEHERGPIFAAWALHERAEALRFLDAVRALRSNEANLLTAEGLAEIEARRAAIPPPPWEIVDDGYNQPWVRAAGALVLDLASLDTCHFAGPVGAFVTRAPVDIDRLLATVREQAKLVEYFKREYEELGEQCGLREREYTQGLIECTNAMLSFADKLRERDEEIARLRAVVDALPRCTECQTRPATLADQGPDGDTDFTCDVCAPGVREYWEQARLEQERECPGCDPLVTLTDLHYAAALRAITPPDPAPPPSAPPTR